MAKIKLSPTAVSDLQEIKNYISKKLSNPIAADRTINKIIKDYTLLETSPELGASLSCKLNIKTDYRYLVSGKYIVFYKTDIEYVYIYRILYGARNYVSILFNSELNKHHNFE
jgi:addiction module RelE/StbE family toxin